MAEPSIWITQLRERAKKMRAVELYLDAMDASRAPARKLMDEADRIVSA